MKPPATFITYAKHAREHGMQAWYPGRLPKGFRIKSIKSGDMVGMSGEKSPYCEIVFKSGSKTIAFTQWPYTGVDEPSQGATRWGSSSAELYGAWGTVWFGPNGEEAGLHPKHVSQSITRTIAKYMRKVQ